MSAPGLAAAAQKVRATREEQTAATAARGEAETVLEHARQAEREARLRFEDACADLYAAAVEAQP